MKKTTKLKIIWTAFLLLILFILLPALYFIFQFNIKPALSPGCPLEDFLGKDYIHRGSASSLESLEYVRRVFPVAKVYYFEGKPPKMFVSLNNLNVRDDINYTFEKNP